MNTKLRHSNRQQRTVALQGPRRYVLIVEDQRSLSEMLASMLQAAWQCPVLTASNFAEARELLASRGEEIFAAVCDVNLPDAPYGEVIDLVAAQRIPAIALTGTITSDIRQMMMQGQIVDYVLKKGLPSFEYVVQWVGRLLRNTGLKVLVADDSPSSLEIIRRMLGMQGLNVQVAHNGQEALATLKAQPDIKLVLVDYNMPLVDGFEFVMEARRMMGKESLAIIGISGEDHSDISARFLKHGANDFISKPYSFEEMTCRVNQNLEMLELMDNLHYLASVDALTGLYNRRFFFEQGQARHEQARKEGKPVVVAMLDIDHFKSINDQYGHAHGDVVIRHVASCLQKHFPDTLIARIGGEEFAMLNTSQDLPAMRERLEAFRDVLPRHSSEDAPAGVAISISIGLHGSHHPDMNTMLQVADKRLYEAKANGRNRLEG
jgi:diguanylate cyclase (GGDEF)-like protein